MPFWVLQELPGDKLADVAGADDYRVLDIGEVRREMIRAEARAVATHTTLKTQKNSTCTTPTCVVRDNRESE